MRAVMAGERCSKAAVATLSRALDPFELFEIASEGSLPVLLQSGRSDSSTGRCSILAADPFLILRYRQGKGSLKSLSRERLFEGDPFPVLRQELDRQRVEPVPGVPFVGGAIGYLGYGLRRWTGAGAGRSTLPSPWPDLHLAFYDHAWVVDHAAHLTHLIATGIARGSGSPGSEKRRLDLRRMRERTELRGPRSIPAAPAVRGLPRFETSRESYLEMVGRAREFLSAGDIYQVNLSHKIEVEGDWRSWDLYRQLVATHPACFSAYLPLQSHAILCASPERLVSLAGRRAETRPIKGTRARGATREDDGSAREALASGAKERAENVMIVDLARNDLGRVCVPGTVRAEELCRVETLPSVHHLVSTVSGTLREDADRIDLVQALFPGGSMTGAPKIRAMEIIDELEGAERGIYSGSVGYFSFHGDLDLNIVIRSLVVSRGQAELRVGGAILAESDPEAEYQETLDKARPLLELLTGSGAGQQEDRQRDGT
jgi:para-aminobenzoate synthetase component I